MYANFLDQATEIVKQAVEADSAEKYDEAFSLYMKALEYFTTHLKYEKNPKAKEAITAKVKQYMDRAEYLKSVVNGQANANGPSPNGTTATGVKPRSQGGSNSKNEDDAESERFRGALSSAIVTEKPDVKWDDVAGLEVAKDLLKEAVILPVKFPQFFVGKRKPWRSLLLYGPPGTGKTYLAKAVATEADSTFFSVSSSDLVSKWMGESEKLVRELFKLAREQSPSIIFIDEVDALTGQRGENESEAARRIKTEFLVQMQGVSKSEEMVMIMGATNLPYALDKAIRRRFVRRVYIPLPDPAARCHLFKVHLGDTPNELTEADYQILAEKTEGFSGSDISVVVNDALMEPVRKTQEATHFKKVLDEENKQRWVPCSPGEAGAQPYTLQQFVDEGKHQSVMTPKINMRDFEKVLIRARPSVASEDLEEYQNFTKEFGEDGS
eukprot:TRINITY_DN6723_c0_g2_i1.p1 TRINITY_DN6723_c0_g2~~TRINITY_DN6723_c0_g2_i1.p1  ORF type:complete len:439 (-),score=108.31 TRINITY_DN6723_c0_g2_i1:387-1703(-)